MGCIYKITNIINNKGYIGQYRKNDPTARWKRHENDALKNNSTVPLHLAIRKYGWDNFKKEIICIIEDNTKLDDLESYYAEQYDTYIWDGKGYNATLCGKRRPTNFKQKEEFKEKMSKLMTGRKVSEETKKKLSDAKKGKPIQLSEEARASKSAKLREKATGVKCSEEKKAKISASLKGRPGVTKGQKRTD